jgi:hypothetical protein
MPVFKTKLLIAKSQPPSPQVKNSGCPTALTVCVKMHIFLAAIWDFLHIVPRCINEAQACREMRRYTADEPDTTTSVKRLRS